MINVVLGSALLISSLMVKTSMINGAIVARVVGAVLVLFGGSQAGTIRRIIALLSAILAAASLYLPWSRPL